jgi:uncharacterized protein (DUF302 family)
MRAISFSRVGLALVASVCLVSPISAPAQSAQRVFVMVADSVPMNVAAATTAISEALARAGWSVLADHPVGTDSSRCSYAARVVVASQPARATALLARGASAGFAVPVRLSVFEDERGVHVAMVNPLAMDRTMVSEAGLEASGRVLVNDVAALVASVTRGRRVNRPYGQSRDRGVIGKTMGVMAGGPFVDQIETIATMPGNTAADVRRMADQVWQRLQLPSRGKWQLRGVYRLDLEEQGVVILGVSGGAMEMKAFAIVGAGDDDSRSSFKCPGIAHAAAFPLEMVIRRDGGQVRVEVINAMFRMKMYFEDAGRMKFARNMGMPGSIADELKAIVASRVSGP